jgi:acyl dehydratase
MPGTENPMPRLYFEDFVPGTVRTYGSRTLSRDELIAFATSFDPQPMHLDEVAAEKTLLGGLAASGWHTCALLMRMIADDFILDSAGMGAPGVDEVKWLRPVRAGDTLSVRETILEARPSRTRDDRGYVRFCFEVLNQHGEPVLEQTNSIIFGRRPGEAAA